MVQNSLGDKLAYSRDEVAAVTGLSVRTVDALIKRGVIPCRRFGKRVVVGRAALEAVLNERKADAAA